MGDWNTLIDSKTEEEYREHVLYIVAFYKGYPVIVTYLQDTWLVWATRFVRCFTDTTMHIGTRVTSRGEGSHFVLKRCVNLGICDLLTVFQTLENLLRTQFIELKTSVETQKLKLCHRHTHPFFSRIVKRVSVHALDLLLTQWDLVDSTTHLDCTGLFTGTYGLPCYHDMIQMRQANQVLDIGDIDSH